MRTPQFTDISGNRYGRLVVLRRVPNKNGRMRWLCQCDCGGTTEARGEHLKNLRIRSCGCFDAESHTKHGMSRTPEYIAWQGMKARCHYPSSPHFAEYGGRGIAVCERWLNSFENFYADMGDKPEGRYSVDRLQNHLGYGPMNCRWATDMEQVYNRRTSLLCTIDGVTKPVKHWCNELKIVCYQTARQRIKAGWSPIRAVTARGHSMQCISDPASNMHS